MSIAVGTNSQVFLLSTGNTSYAFGIDDRAWYGISTGARSCPPPTSWRCRSSPRYPPTTRCLRSRRRNSRCTAGCATRSTALKVTFPDGTRELVYRYDGYDTEQGDGWEELVLHLKDEHYAFRMDLALQALPRL